MYTLFIKFSFTFFFLSKNSQAITVEEDKSKEEELKMMQQVWEQSQPGRAKKVLHTYMYMYMYLLTWKPSIPGLYKHFFSIVYMYNYMHVSLQAQQSRQKFLESHTLNKEEGLSDEGQYEQMSN